MKKYLVIGLILLILFSGCSSRETVSPENEVSSNESAGTSNTSNETKSEPSKFQIGQTFTADSLKFTLNSIEFKDVLESDSEYLSDKTAAEGKTFLIADITVENISDSEEMFGSSDIKVLDEEGFAYDSESFVSSYLEDNFIFEFIPVGGKKKGKMLWEVPKDQEITFRAELGFINKKIAEYEINSK